MKNKTVLVFVVGFAILACIATLAIARAGVSNQKFVALLPSSTPTQNWVQPLAELLPTDTSVPPTTVPPTAVPIIVVSTMTPTNPPTVVPTETSAPSVTLAPTLMQVTNTFPTEVGTAPSFNNEWQITYGEHATSQMKNEWAKLFVNWKLDPKNWATGPNVPNRRVPGFRTIGKQVPDGAEWGQMLSVFCQQDQRCDIPVSAMHYRMISGDYSLPGIDSCSQAATNVGCAIILVNVTSDSFILRDQKVDAGFTVAGVFFNGDVLPIAITAIGSHTANQMLNLDGGVNKGGNCSKATGCRGVRVFFAVFDNAETHVPVMTGVAYAAK